MRFPGKIIVDEFYVHLSALSEVQNQDVVAGVERVLVKLPSLGALRPNVAKVNLRSGRVSLLAYPRFFDEPFPELAASWVFQPGVPEPFFRSYGDALNPPILHRKERLVSWSHPDRGRWEATTITAESLGLFDNTSTIGFKLNWHRLIADKGYRLIGEDFVPLGNDLSSEPTGALLDSSLPVQRHLTALSRSALSAPVQLLIRQGLLSAGRTFFDYGCGRGSDVSTLTAQGFQAAGWDPHYVPNAPRVEADIVNLGFVVNVIEDPAERVEALTHAFRLARVALAVGVMLHGSDNLGRPFRDGILTARNTFQKYFSQGEFKDYLEQVLHRAAFMVGPGVAFVFASNDAEQNFAAGRYRSRALTQRLLATSERRALPTPVPRLRREPRQARLAERRFEAPPPKSTAAEQKLAAARPYLDSLWSLALDLGRHPDPDEIPCLSELLKHTGSLRRAQRLLSERFDLSLLEAAAKTRADDLRVFMATQHFSKRPAYRQLGPRLQRDIKAFFGDYRSALEAGHHLLLNVADPAKILTACKEAASKGVGFLEKEHSLQLHVSMVEELPALLRAFVACGLVLWDSLGEVQLIKIHVGSGKLTLMEFDGFDESPIPLLRRRIKIFVRRLDYEIFEYGSAQYPKPALYRKSLYLNEDYPGYAEQLAFDEQLERLGLIGGDEFGPPATRLDEMLAARRLAISERKLVPSDTMPDLDSSCGKNFTYRDFIECGETQQRLGLPNLPLRPETYNALYALSVNLLDPLIEYFGLIRLTYGFASRALSGHIARGIAPRLDQHACCERTARGDPVCARGGAACDFIVEDEDMKSVADWIISNLAFDRLYYYGPNCPVHLSFAPNPAGEAFQMVRSASGRLMPRPYGATAVRGTDP